MTAVTTIPTLPHIIHRAMEDNQYTRDTTILYKQDLHPVFVYDDYMKGFANHIIIENAKCLGTAYLRESNQILYYDKTTRRPMSLYTDPNDELAASIKGEVYYLPTETLTYFDLVKENGVKYKRIKQLIDFGAPQPESLYYPKHVWSYAGVFGYMLPEITAGRMEIGDLFTRKKNNKFRYYSHIKTRKKRA